MNKKLPFVFIALLVALGAGVFYVSSNSEDGKTVTKTEPGTILSTNQIDKEAVTRGNYLDYKIDLVESSTGKRVLFFHAPWCSQCKELDESIKNGKIPEGVTIFKTDFDSNQKLRQQFGVTLQTTLVLLDDKGNLAKKYVSYEEPNLEAVIKNLLQ